MPPRRRKVEVQPSRTDMHQGLSGIRGNENKWADALNFLFSENKTKRYFRKKQFLSLPSNEYYGVPLSALSIFDGLINWGGITYFGAIPTLFDNIIHTLHRGPAGRYYAFGNYASYMFYDNNAVGGSSNLYNGVLTWNGSQTFGQANVLPASLWFVTQPVLLTARDYSKPQDIYKFEINGQWKLDYPATFQVEIGANNTFRAKANFDGIWSPYFSIKKGTVYPLRYGLNIAFFRSTEFVEGTRLTFSVNPWDSTAKRLNCVNFDDAVYLSGSDLVVHKLDHNLIQTNIDTSLSLNFPDARAASQFNLTSKFMFEFYEHLVIVKDNFVQWSDLRNFWEWMPRKDIEADYKVLAWKTEDATWAGAVGDIAYIHFPNAIHMMRYVGRPTIMRIDKLPDVVGCAFDRALIVYNGVQYYLGIDGFYAFDGQGLPQNIGAENFKTFQNKVEAKFLNKTFAFLDIVNNLVGWAFVSSGTVSFNGCDRAIIYNYVEKHWTFVTLNNVHSHCVMAEPVIREAFIQSSGTIASDSGAIVEETTPALINLWGGISQVQRDEKTADTTVSLLTQTQPFLETNDLIYNNVHDYKDNDLLIIDADYDSDCVGVDVYISVREFISAPVTYTLVGRWTKTMVGKQLDYKPVAGRVYRFKFQPIGSTNGLRDLRFYAWGERILLPNDTIGPEQ